MSQLINDNNSSGESGDSDNSMERPPSMNQTMPNNTRETGVCQSDHLNRSHHDASLINPGPPARYRLNTERTNFDGADGKVRLWTYGRKDTRKQNKVLLMVGQTGTGKTTIINTMINYLLGVKFEDEKFYEITEEQEHKDQTKSQTSAVTVYEVFDDENAISLTIIDTPGYADTEGFEKDGEIAEYLTKLFSSGFGIKIIDAVCFVMKASQNRLSGKEFYIFHSVLSLFGRDIENNIVFLLTHSDGGPPTDVINAINTAEIPCRRDEDNQPVHFLFNSRQKQKRDKQYNRVFKSAWELGEESMGQLFSLLDENNRKSVQMTLEVLIERKRLEACVSNLNERIIEKELKMKELSEIQDVLEQNREKIKKRENFEFTVDRVYREKVPIENAWRWNSEATCCTVCEENCHNYCWWVSPNNLSDCFVMKNNNCTVCTRKCHYTKHVKENKKYVSKTKKVTLTFNDLEKEYESAGDKRETKSDKDKYEKIKKEHENNMKLYEEKTDIEKENIRRLAEIEQEKSKLVYEAYSTIMNLSKIALKADSAFTLQYLDFLIPRLKEDGREEWMKNLEDLRKAADEEKNKGALRQLREFTGRKWNQFVNFVSETMPNNTRQTGVCQSDHLNRDAEGSRVTTVREGNREETLRPPGAVEPLPGAEECPHLLPEKRRSVLPAGGRRFHSGSPGVGAAVVRQRVWRSVRGPRNGASENRIKMSNSEQKSPDERRAELFTKHGYTLKTKLGQGVSGAAFLVNIEEDLYVIKEIICRYKSDTVKQEVDILKDLHHAYIVGYEDSFEDREAGLFYIVMEYCAEGDLYKRMQTQGRNEFREEQIRDWIVQICLALQCLHEKNILHRDLKPQNVFLTEDGYINLGDVGCSKALERADQYAQSVVGAELYVSPEVLKQRYTSKSDIWSLGWLIHDLCMLDVWSDILERRFLHITSMRGTPPDISEKYSEELRELIKEMLSCDPKDRPSADEILAKPFLNDAVNKNTKIPEDLEKKFMQSIMTFDQAYNEHYNELEILVSEWKQATDSLEEIHYNCTAGSLSGAVIGAAGGITALVGAALAPFTLGASLIVTAVGVGVGVAGGVTGAASNITNTVKQKSLRESLQQIEQNYNNASAPILNSLKTVKTIFVSASTLDNVQMSRRVGRCAAAGAGEIFHLLSNIGRFGAQAAKIGRVAAAASGVLSDLLIIADVDFIVEDSGEIHDIRNKKTTDDPETFKSSVLKSIAQMRKTHKELCNVLNEINKARQELNEYIETARETQKHTILPLL